MTEINAFYEALPNAGQLTKYDVVDRFIYFMTVVDGQSAASTQEIDRCFDACHIPRLARLRSYLSEHSKGRTAKFIRKTDGYVLERGLRDAITASLSGQRRRAHVQVDAALRALEPRIQNDAQRSFLKETLDCLDAGANRAAIVMCWLLTIDHLYGYVLARKLVEFNSALAKNTDKRVRIDKIAAHDDFSEIPESKFIEFCRAAFITNDVRKILDEKLGVRNTCAHPSGVEIFQSKVIGFIEDLVTNVILKYPV